MEISNSDDGQSVRLITKPLTSSFDRDHGKSYKHAKHIKETLKAIRKTTHPCDENVHNFMGSRVDRPSWPNETIEATVGY
jgi:hypothetical protein